MSPDLDELLTGLLVYCLKEADRIPTPAEPPDAAVTRELDETLYRFARTQEVEPLSPAVAAAMIPRLRIARLFAGVVEAQFEDQAELGDASADGRALLEWLLVKLWHEAWEPRWLRGDWD